MKRIIKYSVLCLFFMTGCVFASCINETEPQTDSAGMDNAVKVYFSLSNSEGSRAAITRADAGTEAGDNTLNENKIERLDLFVFDGNGALSSHKNVTTGDERLSYDQSKVNADKGVDGVWTLPDLKRQDLEGKTIYIVANWTENGAGAVKLLSDLQAANIDDSASFEPNKQQTTFLMDGKAYKQGYVGKNYVVNVNLSRALAKIRLNVKKDGRDDITTAVSYQIVHYATNASILSESEDSVKAPLASLPENIDLENGTGMLTGETALTYQTVDGQKQVIFYTYPNNWWNGQTNPHVAETILDDRQTYILIKAKYNDKDCFYKIPVNNQLPEDNDENKTTEEWTKILSGLYNIGRNHIYDITVNIDREGGTKEEPVELTLQYKVIDWEGERGGDIIFE